MTSRSKLLREGEHLEAFRAEYVSGPGWSNAPLWVYIRSVDGSIRVECLQPSEQPGDVLLLYGIAAQVHAQLLRAIEGACSCGRRSVTRKT